MPTARALLTGALLDLGAIASGQALSGNEAADGLTVLNQYRDYLGLERGMLYATVSTVKTLAKNTTSYTIGDGGSINIPRPAWIDRAGVIIDTTASPTTERPIRILADDEYASWAQKARTGSPLQAIWYNRALEVQQDIDSGTVETQGRIVVLPVPDVPTTQLVLYTPGGELTAFADLTTDYTFARGFERALRKNLALELAPMYSASPSALLFQQAKESLAAIKRIAPGMGRLRCDPGLVSGGGGRWSINSDSYPWRP